MRRLVCRTLILSIVVLVGCASAPSSPITLNAAAKCRDQLASFSFGGGATSTVSDPGFALIALSSVFTLGGNFLGYDLCKDMTSLSRAPNSTLVNDTFHSEDGEFSVSLPLPGATPLQGNMEIWQRTMGWWENVFFVPIKTDGAIYGISINKRPSPDETAMSLDQYADSLIDTNSREGFDVSGDVKVTRMYKQSVMVGVDTPSVLEIYRPERTSNGNEQQFSDTAMDTRPYLIYYVIKTSRRIVVLSISWPFACPKCGVGPESDIRNMDPEIATFVKSIKFNNPAGSGPNETSEALQSLR